VDDKIVVITVAVFWGLWWIEAVWFRRSWIPVIPFVPLALGILGIALNWFGELIGSYVVIAIHVAILLSMARNLFTTPPHGH
jgi:hypothetical protein